MPTRVSARMNHSDQLQDAASFTSLPNKEAETRFAVARFMANRGPEPPLVPGAKETLPSSNSSSGRSLPAPEVLEIAREAMRDALLSEGLAGQLGGAVVGLHPGVTIDLSRSAILELPEELVDILKDKLERLALSHNQLSSLPVRFSECTSLRYLNIRANQIREFPLSLCHLKRLEILDLGQNQLRVLPPEVANLSSLKVLSIPKNHIRELPLSLANMASLQVLKIKGNPIIFPSEELISTSATTSHQQGCPGGSDTTEVAVTARIKSILKQEAINSREEPESANDTPTAGDKPPRLSRKRAASGRFPVKVSASDVSGLRYQNVASSSFHPMPFKSRCRIQFQPYRATRTAGLGPTTTGIVEKRFRSNSETLLFLEHPETWDQCADLSSGARSDTGKPDEAGACHRNDIELSYGSTAQGHSIELRSSTTSADSTAQRCICAQQLSAKPKRRRISKCLDPIVTFAKGMLYAILQIHPMIQQLATLACDQVEKQPSLQIVIYSTNCHIEVLELEIQKYDTAASQRTQHSSQTNVVYRACQKLMAAYRYICTSLVDGADASVDKGHARSIRTLLIFIYNCIMQLRATILAIRAQRPEHCPANPAVENTSIRPHPHPHLQEGVAAGADKPASSRNRNDTLVRESNHSTASAHASGPFHDGPLQSMTPCAEPGESPRRLQIRATTRPGIADPDPDGLFDKILLCLQNSANVMLRILPSFNGQLAHGLRTAVRKRAPVSHIQHWTCLAKECANAILHTQTIKREIYLVKMKGYREEPGADFWDLIVGFVASWTALVTEVMACVEKMLLPPDTRARLKPIQESMKRTSRAVVGSPWRGVFSSARNDAAHAFESSTSPRAFLPAARLEDAAARETFVAGGCHGRRVDGEGVLSARGGAAGRGDAGVERLWNLALQSPGSPAASDGLLGGFDCR